jgi:uncharacterized glyoxalase superfamily protein PhnB
MIKFNSLSPNIFVSDMEKSLGFYQKLGFVLQISVPETKPFHWSMISSGELTLMLQAWESLGDQLPEVQPNEKHSLLFYIQVQGLMELFDQFKDSVFLLKGLEKTFYGATEFSLMDPDGYILTFAEDL